MVDRSEGSVFIQRRDRPALFGWVVMIPCFLMLVVVGVIPLGYTLYISLHKFRFLDSPNPSGFIGLNNLITALQDYRLWFSIGRTFIFTAVTIPLEVALGLGLAVLLNRALPGKRIIRTLIILPYMISPIVLAAIWKMLYDPQYGVINGLLIQLGILSEQVAWLSNPKTALGALIVATAWQWYPFAFLLLTAGLETIPIEEYEAGQIDGASSWQLFRFVTVPHLMVTFSVLLVIRTIDALKTFALIFSLTRGGPGTSTELVSYYIYQTTFGDFNIGYGAALGIILMVLMMVIKLSMNRIFRQYTT